MSSLSLRGISHIYDQNKQSEQVFDDTYFPILTLATHGVPFVDLMTQLYALRDPLLEYGKANNIHTVLVSDLTNMKTPDAVTRRGVSVMAAEKDVPFQGSHLATVFIVANPLMRGIITAISWVAGESMVPNIYTPNVAGAIKEITKLYTAVGQEMPEFPAEYQFDPPTL